MKKMTIFCIFCLTIIASLYPVHAASYDSEKLNQVIQEINRINDKYQTDFSVLTENEFYTSSFKDLYDGDYQNYITYLLEQDIGLLEQMLVSALSEDEVIEVEIHHLARSTAGSKTLLFFDGNNSMTLKYKYTGGKFDVNHKPTATVQRINSKMFFEMSSYKGSFKNANKTYSVVASGRVITPAGIVSGKSYTVNFNL